MSEFLFVYGTLGRNAGHEMHQHLVRHAAYVGNGTFRGRLYRVSHYPGAVASPDPADVIFGELYRVNAVELFTHLDDYEGCGPDDPEPTEFVRRRVAIDREDGTQVEAWIYLLNRTVTDLPRIASGRFAAGS